MTRAQNRVWFFIELATTAVLVASAGYAWDGRAAWTTAVGVVCGIVIHTTWTRWRPR